MKKNYPEVKAHIHENIRCEDCPLCQAASPTKSEECECFCHGLKLDVSDNFMQSCSHCQKQDQPQESEQKCLCCCHYPDHHGSGVCFHKQIECVHCGKRVKMQFPDVKNLSDSKQDQPAEWEAKLRPLLEKWMFDSSRRSEVEIIDLIKNLLSQQKQNLIREVEKLYTRERHKGDGYEEAIDDVLLLLKGESR